MRKTILFTECENHNDLNNYVEDLELSGAKLILATLESDEEMGKVVVEVENIENFKTAFMVTDAYDFATII